MRKSMVIQCRFFYTVSIFAFFIFVPYQAVFAENITQSIVPLLLSVDHKTEKNFPEAAVLVTGTGQDIYRVYDENNNLMGSTRTNKIIDLPFSGRFIVELNNTYVRIVVPPRHLLHISSASVTNSSSDGPIIVIFDETGTEQLAEVSPNHSTELIPTKYTFKMGDQYKLVTIKATKNVIVDRTFKITVSPPTILIPLKPSDSPFNSRPADIVVIECDGSPMPSIIHIFECIMNQMDKNNIGQRTQDLLAGWLGGKLGGMAVGKISKLNTSLSRGAEEFLKVGAITAIAYGKHSHLPAIVADHVLGQWSNPNKVEIKSPLVVQKHRTSDLSYWTPQGFLLPLAVEAYQMYSFVGKAMRAYDAAGIFRDAAASVRGCGLPFGHAVICVPD
jgi:hypothetical protein